MANRINRNIILRPNAKLRCPVVVRRGYSHCVTHSNGSDCNRSRAFVLCGLENTNFRQVGFAHFPRHVEK